MSSMKAIARAPRQASRFTTAPRVTLLAALALAAGSAWAEPAAPLDRASIQLGGFYVKPKIQAGADTDYGRVQSREEEGDNVTLPRIKAEVLLGDKHAIAMDYFTYDKKYNPSLAGSTTLNGQPASGTATANAKLRLDLAKVSYKWWIGEGNDVFAVGLGAAYYRAKISGSATARVDGVWDGVRQTREVTGTADDSASTYAPVLELGWRHSFSPEVRMYAEATGVKKNGGKVNGHIYSGAVGVEWFAMKNVGVVLDYGMQRIDLTRDSERDADLRIKLAGPAAYVKVRF